MTTHELERFMERAWNDPAHPPAHIPVEVTQFALERARRVRACELKRLWAPIFRFFRAPTRRTGQDESGDCFAQIVAKPC